MKIATLVFLTLSMALLALDRPNLQILNAGEKAVAKGGGPALASQVVPAPTFVEPKHLNAGRRSEQGTAEKWHEEHLISGWRVHVNTQIDVEALAKVMPLLRAQLDEIIRVVPAKAVGELQKVPLWINPEYPKVQPRAEFHSDVGWLRENGRDPLMAKGVEFTNVRIYETETRRMPNFALHELAHAYHNRSVRMSFSNLEIKKAYNNAKAGGKYDRVERKDSEGRSHMGRAYAMTNPQEYFAECTEAYFSRNDFFPFTRIELKQHDPEMFTLLEKLWDVTSHR